jgi:putative ABC transport system permease protein
MKFGDILGISVEGIGERKIRFFLNLVGILIGCAAITGLISITQGMNNEINEQMSGFGVMTITVMPDMRARGGGGFPSSRGANLDWRTVATIDKINHVDVVAPTVSGGTVSYSIKGSRYFASVTGVTEHYFNVNSAMEIEYGRALVRSDKAGAVIGFSVANPDRSKDPVFKVGDRMRIMANVGGVEKELTLRVVGILKDSGGGFSGSNNALYIPLITCEQFFETSGRYSSIQVLVDDKDKVDAVAGEIENNIDGVMALTAAAAMSIVDRVIGTIEAVLGGVAAISLLVAGVGIVNTMIVSVMERTKEIGTMKAIGAKSWDILALFISEAAFTGVIGGILGAAFGFVLSRFIGDYIGVRTAPTLSLGLLVVGFSVVTSVVSGIYPAWRASRLNPVEALRNE